MNTDIIKQICKDLNVKERSVTATLQLLEEGNTIPFIARYRKEATNALNEEQIRQIYEVYTYQQNLLKRKEDVLRLIEEKGLLTDEISKAVMNASKLVEVEDLYRPYKEKKKTKATEAIRKGLKPLADEIMKFPLNGSLEELALLYIKDDVQNVEQALEGASYIIAEGVSDNATYRKWIRRYTYINGNLVCKKKKNAEDEGKTYDMYYDYIEKVREIKPHRILAINRAEKEKIITVSIDINIDEILTYLEKKVVKDKNSFVIQFIKNALLDGYKRLIAPSIEREIRNDLTEKGEDAAIANFSSNLEKLLLQPPIKDKIVLGFDPAYRTGCKLAVMDSTGKMLKIDVIYPHEPRKEYEDAKRKVLQLIKEYHINLIAIGNGTASRESEKFIADIIKDADHKVEYIIVNEAGASVYSASKLAIEEFPDLTVEKRSAVSIGRRIQDPLAELVKIDPESIGVGLYQHDVKGKKLSESLDFIVSKVVNNVGVNINTASASLLKYVAGITKKNIQKILAYRDEKGKIKSREEIERLVSDKVYKQAIGFLRIIDGENILDATGIHPESYQIAIQFLNEIHLNFSDLGTEKLISAIDKVNLSLMAEKLGTDIYTLEDIMKALKKPNRDPRDDMPKPLLKSDVLEIEDLKVGMKLQGTVRNVVDFGAFIDIGLHNDGLAHISKLTNRYIKHPSEVLSVGDIVDCYVDEVFLDKRKVALSLLDPSTIG